MVPPPTLREKNAGLNIDIEVSKIDDNGFVTLELILKFQSLFPPAMFLEVIQSLISRLKTLNLGGEGGTVNLL